MTTYFVGVDFGTIHTKACVRADPDVQTTPVVVNDGAVGAARYLWPSSGANWTDQVSPKVLLCGAHDIHPTRENQALQVAAQAVSHCVSRALDHIGGSDGEVIVQLGLPTQAGITDERAEMRYELIAEQAIALVGDRRLRRGTRLLDERLAALALLNRARFEFGNGALMVIDGGGWTTHASFLRWVQEPESRVSLHGSDTVMHGVQDVVRDIARSLRCDEADAERLLDGVAVAAYASCRDKEALDLAASVQTLGDIGAMYARAAGVSTDDAERTVGFVLDELRGYVEHRRLQEVWDFAWRGGWEASPGSKHYSRYVLLLLGGASRIGRRPGIRLIDPIARRLNQFQQDRTIPFTGIVYPEMNRQFWTVFNPLPDAEAVPYLFVAGGYTLPLPDWPEQLQREAIALERPREKAHYEMPESEPG